MWNEESVSAFNALKRVMSIPPNLVYAKDENTLLGRTEACNIVLGS